MNEADFGYKPNHKKRNYRPLVIWLTIIIDGLVVVLSGLPPVEGFDLFDVHILPMLNAIFNSFTFVFLLLALIFIMKKNIIWHKRFIYSAFVTTSLFLISYVAYHYLAGDSSFGGEGIIRPIYFFILITHIVLAAVIVPLALASITRAWNMDVPRHRKIARWTMPLWLYVSLTGVIVYLMIRPYY